MFTCTTDTGELIWDVVGKIVFFSAALQEQSTSSLGIFEINLTSITGNIIVSVATVRGVHFDYNDTGISCADSANPLMSGIDRRFVTVVLSGTTYKVVELKYNYVIKHVYRTTISSSYFNLYPLHLLCHHQLGSSTGHTPLCTQLHCHC